MPALISYPDNTLSAAVGGGVWSPAYPIDNIKNPQLSVPARSINRLTTSTVFIIDLTIAKSIGVVGICRHNITASGYIRVTGYADSGMTITVADSMTQPAWPPGFTADKVASFPKNWTYCFPAAITAQYWKIQITDTTNPAGYIELGRCWLGEVKLSGDISFGYANGYVSADSIEYSLGRVRWGSKQTPARALTAAFNYLNAADRRTSIILQKYLTETDEAYWVTESRAGAEDMLIDAFPCFLGKTSPVIAASLNINQSPISVVERI